MSFIVLNNPILATIQDSGRYGLTHLGITTSGAADMFAYTMANKLLDNPPNTNSLEIFHGNITLQATEKATIAITGATGEFYLNTTPISPWETYSIEQNDVIKIGKLSSGMILYISVLNGFDILKELGSNSTTLKENIGGISGKKIIKNMVLPFGKNQKTLHRRLQKKYIPKYTNELELRTILSYQHQSFSKEEKEKFFHSTYTVSNEISRMGYKLKGNAIQSKLNGIISEGICFGSIQIPNDGQPIILLKERQTIGGYPKLGVVLESDCYKLAQAKPNTKITFTQITMDEASKLLQLDYK